MKNNELTPFPNGSPLKSKIRVICATKDRWQEGVCVVLEAQATTGLPDVNVWPPELFALHTAERQIKALSVWLALDGNQVVGHALVLPIPAGHRDWSLCDDITVTKALTANKLVEFGGLAVKPSYYRQGIASKLVKARLAWVRERDGLIPVASIWVNSAGSQSLACANGHIVGKGFEKPYDLFVYDM